MAVYVDDLRERRQFTVNDSKRAFRGRWSNLTATTQAELDAFLALLAKARGENRKAGKSAGFLVWPKNGVRSYPKPRRALVTNRLRAMCIRLGAKEVPFASPLWLATFK